MNEQWQELKETITEMRDNDGTGTQQEVCKFLANLMETLEKQMQEPKTGHWKFYQNDKGDWINECSVCGLDAGVGYQYPYCPNCGAHMREEKA